MKRCHTQRKLTLRITCEKLKLERAALEAEYAAREEQLLTKIAALEAQMK